MTCWCKYMCSSMYQSYTVYTYIYIYIFILREFALAQYLTTLQLHRQGATYVWALGSWTIAPHTLALKA